jgi:hypothetical protein
MDNNNESVFLKIKKNNKNDIKIDMTNIISSIPPDYYNKEQPHLQNDKEIRWRFFLINSKKYVEISVLENGQRTYINKNGNQIFSFVPKEYNKYVVKQLYYYPNDDSD